MRMSQLFGRTLRETPSEAELPSHQLLLRAGMIRRNQQCAGLFTCMPLAQRVVRRIHSIVREEMDALGGQELSAPLVNPADLWRASGRWQALAGQELLCFTDRQGREFVLAMTHEESITDIVRQDVRSYRQLPLFVYQIKLKFRDEPRPRGGLIRLREFSMKDGYSFHTSPECLDSFYEQVATAYVRVFSRCGLEVLRVHSDTGLIGGTDADEFMLLSESGEDTLMLCGGCGYAANAEAACFDKGQYHHGDPLPIETVETPGHTTIQQVAECLGVPIHQTLKAVFYMAKDEPVFVAIRGDLEVNEIKLRNVLAEPNLRSATATDLQAHGLVAGYASPVGIENVTVVADDSVCSTSNLVAGANRVDHHFRNVNYGRDFTATIVTDVAQARPGDCCRGCGTPLHGQRAIEVGNIFKLGSKYSEAMNATFLDSQRQERPFIMGCYGMGMERLLASIVEAHHDANGIRWPISVAPYQIYLLRIGNSAEIVQAAQQLYDTWTSEGYEVLYDDREESPGVKFNDADLIGIPIRITVSARTLKQQAVEFKYRHEVEKHLVSLSELSLASCIEQLKQRLPQPVQGWKP